MKDLLSDFGLETNNNVNHKSSNWNTKQAYKIIESREDLFLDALEAIENNDLESMLESYREFEGITLDLVDYNCLKDLLNE